MNLTVEKARELRRNASKPIPTQFRAYSLTAKRYCIGTLSIKEGKYFIEEYGTTHEVDKQTVEEKYF